MNGRPSIRQTLTWLYGVLFFLAGAAVVVTGYLLVRHTLAEQLAQANQTHILDQLFGGKLARDKPLVTATDGSLITVADLEREIAAEQRRLTESTLNALLGQSLLITVAIGLLAVALGWLTAGRVLAPLKRITQTARRIAARSLDERIRLSGPHDELKELADTFDAMLSRLDHAFAAQQRFVANASHELRTPLTTSRTLLQVAITRPDASADLRELAATLLEINTQQWRLADALLTLARSEHLLTDTVPVDLGELTEEVVASTDHADIEVRADCRSAPASGEPVLLTQLVRNLVTNAVRYNHPSGWVSVATGQTDGRSWLVVDNTGPTVADVDEILQPFRRLGGERTGEEGSGLGLSIVRSVTQAHGGELTVRPRPEGGLSVRVTLPAAAPRQRPSSPPSSPLPHRR
jgi:signal transduction histidine kinase